MRTNMQFRSAASIRTRSTLGPQFGFSVRLLSALLYFYSIGYAEVVYPGFGTIAQIADGGGIQTEFVLTNLDDTEANYFLRYYDDGGNLLSLATNAGTGDTVYGTLGPHASRSILTTGTAPVSTQGWARIQTLAGGGTVSAIAIFRFSTGPWAGSEVVVPADTWFNNRFSVAFDNSNSTTIGLALANPAFSNDAVG